jgi:protein-S-isoprenylcysteine O-methyltransferase Ste14
MSDRTPLPSLGPRGEGWFLIQVVLLAIVIAVGVFGEGWPDQARVPRLVAAGVLGAGGASLAAAAVGSLGRSITPLPRPVEGADLKTTGPFGLVRHPIYGGLFLMALAWTFLTSPWAIIPSAALGIFFALKARLEEHWLAQRYPGYADYSRKVRRRLVPYLW